MRFSNYVFGETSRKKQSAILLGCFECFDCFECLECLEMLSSELFSKLSSVILLINSVLISVLISVDRSMLYMCFEQMLQSTGLRSHFCTIRERFRCRLH